MFITFTITFTWLTLAANLLILKIYLLAKCIDIQMTFALLSHWPWPERLELADVWW